MMAQQPYVRKLYAQTEILVMKNAKVFWGRKFSLLIRVFATTLCILVFWQMFTFSKTIVMQQVADAGQKGDLSAAAVPLVPKCTRYNSLSVALQQSCIALAYTPQTARITAAMDKFSSQQGLKLGQDVVGFANAQTAARKLYDDLGGISAMVEFIDTGATTIQYTLWLNLTSPALQLPDTISARFGMDSSHLMFGQAFTNAFIASTAANTTSPSLVSTLPIRTSYGPYAYNTQQAVNSAQAQVEVISQLLINFVPVAMILGISASALISLSVVASEKRRNMMKALRMMGLLDSSYWLSWFTVSAVLMICSSLAAAATMSWIGGPYAGVSFHVMFVCFLAFDFAFTSFAFLLTSLVTKPTLINLFVFAMFAAALVTELVLLFYSPSDNLNNASAFSKMWSPQMNGIARFGISLLPWFHFGKIYSQINVVNYNKLYFDWSNMFEELSFPISRRSSVTWSASSPMDSVYTLFALSAGYMAAAWYLGQVFSSEWGASKPFYFPLLPSYWGLQRKRNKYIAGDTLGKLRAESMEKGSVLLHKLSKSYEKTTALKELSMELRRDEVCCLLGHNGSGKSTLMNILTGFTGPTHGSAFVFGLDVITEISEIQSRMGICTQDDVLWGELTAREHLTLYGRFKGMTWSEIRKVVAERLEDVALTEAADNKSMTYSGGMKRRLSVAISSMGDPQIILLDEPTTGMDPLSRRKVWQLIEKLKAGRVLVLTTHSMEEADILGDQIAVMSLGRLRAIGSSLFLKNHYGRGYQITMLVDPIHESRLLNAIPSWLPGAEIVSCSAGNITVSLPKSRYGDIPAFFARIQRQQGVVKDWGISNTSLEEVFARLVHQTSQVNAELNIGQRFGQEEDESTLDIDSHVCFLCHQRPGVEITVTTKDGVTLQLDNLICEDCIYARSDLAGTAGVEDGEKSQSVPLLCSPKSNDFSELGVPKTKSESNDLNTEPSVTESFHEPVEHSWLVWILIQFKALIFKDMSYQMRQRKTMVLQVFVLIVVIVLSWVVTKGIVFVDSNAASATLCPQGFIDYLSNSTLDGCSFTAFWAAFQVARTAGFAPLTLASTAFTTKLYDRFTPFTPVPTVWYKLPSPANYSKSLGPLGISNSTFFTWNQKPTDFEITDNIQKSIDFVNSSLVNSSATFPYCSNYVGKRFYFQSTRNQAAAEFFQLYPLFTAEVNQFQLAGSSSQLQWVIRTRTPGLFNSVDGLLGVAAPRSTGLLCSSYQLSDASATDGKQALASIMHHVTNSFLTNVTGLSLQPLVTSLPLISYPLKSNDKLAAALQVLLISLVVFLPFAPMVYRIVVEKQDRQLQLMRMMGLRFSSYWLANYVFNMVIYIGLFGVYIAVAYAIGFPLVAELVSPSLLMISLVISGHAMIGSVFFVASLLRRARTALVLAIVISILAPTICFLFNMFLESWPQEILYVPLFAFPHALGIFVGLSSQDLTTSLMTVFVSGTLLMLAGAYLHAVIPSAYGHSEHPFFFLPASVLQSIRSVRFNKRKLLRCCRCRRKTQKHKITAVSASIAMDPTAKANVAEMVKLGGTDALQIMPHLPATTKKIPTDTSEDDDVKDERERLMAAGERGKLENPVCIRNLQKIFRKGRGKEKRAVNGLYLGVKENECFGLLGPNGAGKTTTLSILSGALVADGGEAYVAGCSALTEPHKLFSSIGICPQFDSVWPDLTVQEHLYLFSRLKGVPWLSETAAVRRAAEEVLLDGDPFLQLAAELSGGMRRRLSLAISFLGNSKVVFLDEPTTGLDPETRRSIWNIISNAKKSRSLILTTHSMEEAETLCTRLGIMVSGRLRCIGNPLHLKAKYGDGYLLKCIFQERVTNTKQIDAFITEHICEEAKQVQHLGHTIAYVLPKASVSVPSIFASMEKQKKALRIQEWGLNQTSLDEVFIKLATKHQSYIA